MKNNKHTDPHLVRLDHGFVRRAPLEFVPYWKLTVSRLGTVHGQRKFDHEPTQQEVQEATTEIIHNLRRDLFASGRMPWEFDCTVTRHMTVRETE